MEKKNKLIISASVWLLFLLVHSFMLGAGDNATMFWGDPRSYYSVWIIDLLLIGLYYTNYYRLAPYIIRTKQYSTYIWFSIIFMALTVLLPIIFYYAFGWSLPGSMSGKTPIYLAGTALTLAVLSVGLSIRAVKEWVRLEDACMSLREELAQAKAARADVYVDPSHPKKIDVPTSLPEAGDSEIEFIDGDTKVY